MVPRIYDAKYWRARAAELRAVAEQACDPISKKTVLQIAEDYQRLAQNCRGSDDNQHNDAA